MPFNIILHSNTLQPYRSEWKAKKKTQWKRKSTDENKKVRATKNN